MYFKYPYFINSSLEIDLSETEKMEALNICSFCDFRTLKEQAESPDKWYNIENIKKFPLPIGHGRVDKFKEAKAEDFQKGEGHYLYKANHSYVNIHAHQFKAFFKILLEPSNYPIPVSYTHLTLPTKA